MKADVEYGGTPEAFAATLPVFIIADCGAEAYELLLGMRALGPWQCVLDLRAHNEHLRLHLPQQQPITLPVIVRWPAAAATSAAATNGKPPPTAGGGALP